LCFIFRTGKKSGGVVNFSIEQFVEKYRSSSYGAWKLGTYVNHHPLDKSKTQGLLKMPFPHVVPPAGPSWSNEIVFLLKFTIFY
jgi:hypothetical protein